MVEMNYNNCLEMKTEPIVIFISEMNIELEMKHHNKMEMKKELEMKATHHTEMK